MRLRIVPLIVALSMSVAPALAEDSIPADRSLADVALGGLTGPTPASPLVLPDIGLPVEKSLSQDLPSGDSVSLYAGYPGTPALGPKVDSPLIAALDGLQAPAIQTWLDEAFQSYGVVTAGLSHADHEIEFSRFTGHSAFRTPYDIAHLDSTAVRYTWSYDSNWTFEGSWGALKSPEPFAPSMDENRWTASAKYTLPFGRKGSLSAMFAWGLKQESTGDNLNAVALDTECKPIDGWTVFARGNLEQDNALLPSGLLNPLGIRNSSTVSFGTVHDWTLFDRVDVGAGGLYAFGLLASSPTASTPVGPAKGAVAYVRLIAH